MKNTSEELQGLESEISNILTTGLCHKGLIVIGYAGNDNSVMTVLEKMIKENLLPYGIVWCKQKNTELSQRASEFMLNACMKNEASCVIDIDGFDDLLYGLYLTTNVHYPEIDNRYKSIVKSKDILFGGLKSHSYFVKTNTMIANTYPKMCFTFDTTIKTWKELKTCHDDTIVAALYKGKIWAMGKRENIEHAFSTKRISNMEIMDIPKYMFELNESIILGMFYEVIRISICNKGYICFGKNRYYDKDKYTFTSDKKCKIYDAAEISLSYINDKILLTILPTVYAIQSNGDKLEKTYNQYIVNNARSHLNNSQINCLIKEWIEKLSNVKSHELIFEVDNTTLIFNRVVFSAGGIERKPEWPEVQCFQCEEPKMCFSKDDVDKIAVNQLKGLVDYGPIERYMNGSSIESIRLALLSPKENVKDILNHLRKLKGQFITQLKGEKDFLPEYLGFQRIYKRDIDIPAEEDSDRCKLYNGYKAATNTPEEYFKGICMYIDRLATNREKYDLLIIYIPDSLKKMREVKDDVRYFDLHDSLKLYCAEKGIVMQIIQGKTAIESKNNDIAKIMWGLSTGIYSKTVGRLWKPAKYDQDTAYVGLSYVQSVFKGKRISIGCSQLFDAEGNGMRLFLRPIKNLQMIQRNPFMRYEDACRLMLNLKKLYDDSVATYRLRRVVIHKTTFFTEDEIKGIVQGLVGVDDIELLQIQEFTQWRAIRFDSDNPYSNPAGYPIQRGTVIPLDANNFLVWTHGAVQDDELAGKNRNYYKNGRGIPAPLLVRRFLGNASGETLVNEIMMLTKMNWNSGDSFYKVLPVTLDFAKVLSKIAKQDIVIYDKPYDFRFFM